MVSNMFVILKAIYVNPLPDNFIPINNLTELRFSLHCFYSKFPPVLIIERLLINSKNSLLTRGVHY